MNARDNEREDSVTLEILEAIEQESDVTQRRLASRAGVALGLANSYLKRCVRKGLVKIQQAPANRYLYYLTPKGFAEKSRLTAQYLSYSFEFYRKASESCSEAFRHCRKRRWKRVVLCGVSELGEIASLRARELGIEIVAVYAPASERSRFLDREVLRTLDGRTDFDACLVTDLSDPQACYARLAAVVDPERIIVPRILGVRPNGMDERRN